MRNLDAFQTLIKAVSCSDLESEEKSQDYQWLSKTDHVTDKPTTVLAKKKGGEGRRGNNQNKESPTPTPTKNTGSPLRDLHGPGPTR